MEPHKQIESRDNDLYGDLPMVQSLTHHTLKFTPIINYANFRSVYIGSQGLK